MITFTSVFVILFFIFVLQGIWLFISELAGKDLDFFTILKFLSFYAPTIVPMVLPLSVLLASIMTFGSFAENYEFAAMKSAGISLQRAMKMLTIAIFTLAIVSFIFANNVIPQAQYKFLNLRKTIVQQRPAMAIAEGQFNTIGTSNIKVEKKSGPNGEFLEGVTMHVKNNNAGLAANTVIKAKKGVLRSNENSNYLQLELIDGNYYESIIPKKYEDRDKVPFAKSSFQKYIINIDLTKLNEVGTDQDITSEKMLNISELKYTLDSLQLNYKKDIVSYTDNIVQRTDNTISIANVNQAKTGKNTNDILSIYSDLDKIKILEIAKNNAVSIDFSIENSSNDLVFKKKIINAHWLVTHEKFVIAFSCLLMFFIGAPLGAIIRKGGLGLPMVFAIIIFIAYHFLNVFGRKLAEEDAISPFLGSWMSSFLLTPLAVFLTYRATNDIGVSIDLDWLTTPFKILFSKNKLDVKDTKKAIVSLQNINTNEEEFNILATKEDAFLKNVVKNSVQFNYTESYRLKALKVLEQRGVTQEELLLTNSLFNTDYINLKYYIEQYKLNSMNALRFYVVAFMFSIAVIITKNLYVSLVSLINLVFLYISIYKSSVNLSEISKIQPKNSFINTAIAVLFGFPFYIIIYLYNKDKMKEVLSSYN